MNVGIIGGGVFGLAAAIELRERGHGVTVFDQGKVPYENATSTDVAKGIRRTWYGDGGPYVELVESERPCSGGRGNDVRENPCTTGRAA